jgi:hypothetical protein
VQQQKHVLDATKQLIVFSVAFFVVEAWFPMGVVIFGATLVIPLCWYLANHGTYVLGLTSARYLYSPKIHKDPKANRRTR